MVEAEEAQTNELRSDDKGDYWQGLSGLFRQDPRRQDDPEVEALAALVDADSTVIDVGAGAGRLALPLALRTKRVTAVEPSEAMCSELRDMATQENVDLDIVQSTWEKAECEPADLTFAAHVIYTIKDIGSFLRKMTASTRGTAATITWARAPLYYLSPIWRDVYDIERLNLPALPDLLEVLWEMGHAPQLRLGPAGHTRGWPDKEAAVQMLRHRLFIGESRQDLLERLRESVERQLVETPEGWMVGYAPMRASVLVTWPGAAS